MFDAVSKNISSSHQIV